MVFSIVILLGAGLQSRYRPLMNCQLGAIKAQQVGLVTLDDMTAFNVGDAGVVVTTSAEFFHKRLEF